MISKITQGHRVSGTGHPGCYLATSPEALQILRSCVLSQDQACWFCRCPLIRCLSECWNSWKWLKLKVAKWQKKLKFFQKWIFGQFWLPTGPCYRKLVLEGVGGWGRGLALDEWKKFFVIYITLEGGISLEWFWVGFEENCSSPGMTGKLIPGGELISPSFRQCDKQDHTGSKFLVTECPGCYLATVLRPCNFEKLRFEPRWGWLVFVGALSGATLSVEILGNG